MAACEGFLVSILSVAALQAPALGFWSRHVEGDLGMPGFVHRAAGALEVVIVAMRLCGRGPLAALSAGGDGLGPKGTRCCAAAHILTSGLMGGAFWTWPRGVRYRRGLLPALCVATTSTWSTDHWLSTAVAKGELHGLERLQWHLASLGTMAVGCVAASLLHRHHSAGARG